MRTHPSELAESLASLRHAATATQAPAWLPATLHALILACLARLIGRLEDMVQLWRAGLLPPPNHPAAHPAAPGTSRAPPASARRTPRRYRRRRQTRAPRQHSVAPPCRHGVMRPPSAAAITPSRATTPSPAGIASPRLCHARAPPPGFRRKRRLAAGQSRGQFVPFSKQ